MEPTEQFLERQEPPADTVISSAPDEGEASILDLFPNFAESDDITEKTKIRVRSLFSSCSDRSDLETIWNKNDEMYRVKPDASKDDVHRANESTGVFHIGVNQLVSMAYKTFTENPDNYKYGFRGIIDDESANTIRARNAEIMTLLFRKAQVATNYKRNLKRALLDCYKNGTCFVAIPWEKQVVDLIYRDKSTGGRKSKLFIKNNLPGFEFIPIDQLWLDENIDEMESQPAIYIKNPITWSKLLGDSKKNNVKLFEKDGQEGLRDKFSKYLEHVSSSQFSIPKADRMDNADRTLEDRTGERYKHWFVWINLPVNKDSKKWDKDGAEIRCRVRILGDPESCEIIEIRENIFPGGIPVLAAHQTEDDIGMYPISLGEKIETYYDQICTAIDQLIDNRSKNVRRPIVYDPMRVDVDKYDFGHANAVPCSGDVRSGLFEMQIADMTATIMPTIAYCEQKVREILNTTDAVMGMAMGGRTSASEYVSAKAAATTPIFSDMSSIEDALIGEYMRRFSQYVHTFMTHEDLVDQLGPVGAEFQFELADIYAIEMRGVSEAMDKATKVQNLLQLFGMSMDPAAKGKIMLRIAGAMGVENPAEFVVIPAKDQAIKAALWENNEMLVFSQWDEPEQGEMHDIHLGIHQQALWQAQRDKNQNVPMMVQHISTHQQLKRSEQATGAISSITTNGQSSNVAPLPGDVSGQQISGSLGNAQGGSPVSSQPEAPPEAL